MVVSYALMCLLIKIKPACQPGFVYMGVKTLGRQLPILLWNKVSSMLTPGATEPHPQCYDRFLYRIWMIQNCRGQFLGHGLSQEKLFFSCVFCNVINSDVFTNDSCKSDRFLNFVIKLDRFKYWCMHCRRKCLFRKMFKSSAAICVASFPAGISEDHLVKLVQHGQIPDAQKAIITNTKLIGVPVLQEVSKPQDFMLASESPYSQLLTKMFIYRHGQKSQDIPGKSKMIKHWLHPCHCRWAIIRARRWSLLVACVTEKNKHVFKSNHPKYEAQLVQLQFKH